MKEKNKVFKPCKGCKKKPVCVKKGACLKKGRGQYGY